MVENGIGDVRMALGKLHFGCPQSERRNNSTSLFRSRRISYRKRSIRINPVYLVNKEKLIVGRRKFAALRNTDYIFVINKN